MSMFNRSFLSCELIGNLGSDPKSVQTKTGKAMATFSVAVTTSAKDGEGNWSNQTQWVGCTTFGGFAERALKALHKGSMVLVKGDPTVGICQDTFPVFSQKNGNFLPSPGLAPDPRIFDPPKQINTCTGCMILFTRGTGRDPDGRHQSRSPRLKRGVLFPAQRPR